MNEVIYLSEATAGRRRVKLSLAVNATDGITAETGTTVTEAPARIQQYGSAASTASTNNIVFGDDTNCPGSAYVELTAAEITALGVGNHRVYFKSIEVAVMLGDFTIVPDNIFEATTPASAEEIETGVTLKQAIAVIMAAVAGDLSGAGTGTETLYAPDGTTARIVATVDASGNRTLVITLPS